MLMHTFRPHAYYYCSRKRKFLVILGLEITVTSRREARAFARMVGAVAWNF